jgi:putative membrane protein
MKVSLVIGATAIAAICSSFTAAAQDAAPVNRSATSAPSSSDRAATTTRTGASATAGAMKTSAEDYVKQAAMTDMLEVQAGKLAAEKSKNAEVKKFADHMVKDHTETTDKLKKTLSEDNNSALTPPSDLDATHKQMLTELQNAPAVTFDKTYMDMQVKGHRQALELHQGYAANGEDAKLKTFASQVVPKIQEHLTMAERIDQSLAKTASTPSGTSATTGKTKKPKSD